MDVVANTIAAECESEFAEVQSLKYIPPTVSMCKFVHNVQ